MKRKLTSALVLILLLGGWINTFATNSLPLRQKTNIISLAKDKISQSKELEKGKIQQCDVQAIYQVTWGGSTTTLSVNATASTCAEAGAIMDLWVTAYALSLSFVGGILWQY